MPDIDTSVVLPPNMTEAGAKADTTCRLKTGHRYNADGVCEWCNAERPMEATTDFRHDVNQSRANGTLNQQTVPADLPTNKVSPLTNEPFDVDAYLKRLADREAEELARLESLPTAHHLGEIIADLYKSLMPEGFAKRPYGGLRLCLFIDAVKRLEDEL